MVAVATSIKLEPELKQRLERLAEAKDRSAHWLMKRAIEDYVDREEEQEALRQNLLERHRRYEETGLHLTSDEVNDWIDALVRGENPPKPEPHT